VRLTTLILAVGLTMPLLAVTHTWLHAPRGIVKTAGLRSGGIKPARDQETEEAMSLGGHLKTGHTWTLQNRPTKRNQNKSIYTSGLGVSANTFLEKRSLQAYTGLTWAEDTAPQGCDRSADSAAGMAGRLRTPSP